LSPCPQPGWLSSLFAGGAGVGDAGVCEAGVWAAGGAGEVAAGVWAAGGAGAVAAGGCVSILAACAGAVVGAATAGAVGAGVPTPGGEAGGGVEEGGGGVGRGLGDDAGGGEDAGLVTTDALWLTTRADPDLLATCVCGRARGFAGVARTVIRTCGTGRSASPERLPGATGRPAVGPGSSAARQR
jgi:hypothetical protein